MALGGPLNQTAGLPEEEPRPSQLSAPAPEAQGNNRQGELTPCFRLNNLSRGLLRSRDLDRRPVIGGA